MDIKIYAPVFLAFLASAITKKKHISSKSAFGFHSAPKTHAAGHIVWSDSARQHGFKYITCMIIYKPNRPGSVMVAIDYIKYITTRSGKDPVSLIYLGRTEWSTCDRIGPSFSLDTEKRILEGYVFVFVCNQKSRIKIETKLRCFIASRIHIKGKKNLLTKKKVLTVALDAACGATIVAVSGA